MSMPVYDLPDVGDARTIASINDILAAIQGISTGLDGTNVREGGLDERSLGNMMASIAPYTSSNRVVIPNAAAWTQLVITTNVRTGGFTVGPGLADQEARIRAEFQCPSDSAGVPGIPPGGSMETRLVQSIAGVVTFIRGTYRAHNELGSTIFTMDCKLGPGIYDWIAVQYQTVGGGVFHAGFASILGAIHERST